MSERIKAIVNKINILEASHTLAGLVATEAMASENSFYTFLKPMFAEWKRLLSLYERGLLSEEKTFTLMSEGWEIAEDAIKELIAQNAKNEVGDY